MSDLNKALDLLKKGEVVAFPTETVYGLGADATQFNAVEKIFALKNRPSFNPLIIHVASLEIAQCYGVFNEVAKKLACLYWPGPLTLVVPLLPDSKIASNVTAGLDTIAIRCPNHGVAQELMRHYNLPIAAPSANISGYVSPTKQQHVVDAFGVSVFSLAGDQSDVGLESTIIDCSSDDLVILRPGFITREQIEEQTGFCVKEKTTFGAINAPGQLKQHYSPSTKLRMNALCAEANEVCLNFGETTLEGVFNFNLSASGCLKEAAANLFDYLRLADQIAQANNIRSMAVAPIPKKGVGVAINDRLSRAAAQN